MINPAAKRRLLSENVQAAVACAIAAFVLFQFFGSAARGYIRSPSLFWWWISQWLDPAAEAGHGWLILGLSGWLFARNLRAGWFGVRSSEFGVGVVVPRACDLPGGKTTPPESKPQTPDSAVPAAAALLGALVLHAVGFAAQQARISIVALLLFAWGVLRLGGGRRWGAAAAFPLAFMVFAIPVNFLDSIGFWLRVWVVDASSAIARGAGIAVLQSGTQLVAPDGTYNYDVAAACSGIRSLTAMAALSLLAGYLNFRGFWRRALVLLVCFPLVYIGNLARIVAIIFAAEAGGPKWGDIAHEVMGYGIFAIVLGGVLGAIALIRRVWPEAAPAEERPASRRADKGGGEAAGKPNRVRGVGPVVVAAVVLAAVAGEIVFLRKIADLPSRGGAGIVLAADGRTPVELPTFLGTEWIGRRAEISAVEREILPADTGFSRKTYVSVSDSRQQVFMSVVLSGRDRTSIHRPELCLVGQGWTIAGRNERRFRYPGRGDASFAATVLRVEREVTASAGAGKLGEKLTVPQLTAYWFVGADAVLSTHARMFVADAWNRVFHARADRWAYVLIQTDATDGEAAALARMQAVLDAALPAFQRPLPGR